MYRRFWSVLLCLVLTVGLLPTSALALTGSTIPDVQDIVKMDKYDGRDYGIITAVKDQGGSNLCWAYSSVAASEASILRSGIDDKATAANLSLNPRAAAYRVFNRGADPLGNTDSVTSTLDYTAQSGNPYKIAAIFSAWWGPIGGSDATADPYSNASYRLENAFYIPETKDAVGIAAIKEAIAKYGAVTFQYNNMREEQYYNPKNETSAQSSPHACTVIGWDDTIAADNFKPGGATQNGGWLVKNSYSSLEYFYLSYDNTSSVVYAFDYVTADTYDYNYHYDGNVDDFSLRSDKQVANVYQAKKGGTDGKAEFLKAVNVGVSGNDYTLEVKVYTGLSSANSPVEGGTLAATKQVHFANGGFVTVHLDDKIELPKDGWFSVAVRVVSGNATIRECQMGGKYSYAASGDSWSRLSSYVGRIKALTVLEEKPDCTTDGNFTNLVVFCKFADETEFIGNDITYAGATVQQILDNSYNKSTFSVADYLNTVSNGKVKMNTLYLFPEGGGSFTLSKNRSYYATSAGNRSIELQKDWSAAVQQAIDSGQKPVDINGNTYSFAELDKYDNPEHADYGNEIDLLTIIYQPSDVALEGSNSPLWDYQANCNRVEVTENDIDYATNRYVQITAQFDKALYKGADNLPILATGKYFHETMHAFDLKDLYYSSGNIPVSQMSLMGQHTSPVGQYISVKEREALGWLTESQIKTMPYSGEYSLAQASDKNGVVAYKKDLAGGKTLYLEYRRFDEAGNKYDNQRKVLYSCADNSSQSRDPFKSGLVCYLVTTGKQFPQNLGNKNLEMELVKDDSHNAMANWALSAGETMKISDSVSVTVQSLTNDKLTFTISGIGDAPVDPEPEPTPPTTNKTPHNIGTFAADTVNTTYGETVQGLTVSSTTGTVVYSVNNSAVATVDSSSGALTVHKAGSVIVTATVGEDDEHTAVSTSYTLIIAKAVPDVGVVSKTAPTTVYTNTALSAISLSKSGKASGTLALVAGQKLTVGTNDYAWTFTPTDSVNYESVSGKISLTVVQKQESGGAAGGGGGGGGGAAVYTVNIGKVSHGTVSVSLSEATKGDEVFVKLTPEKGYKVDSLTVLDRNNTEVEVTEYNGGYKFTMPASKVTIRAAFAEDNGKADMPIAKRDFADVVADSYYAKAVLWAVEQGVTEGVADNRFAPDRVCTRAEIVTFLYRAAGEPEVNGEVSFADVKQNSYYAKAVAWAVQNGITTGTAADKFSPDDICTRADSVTFLYRAAGKPSIDSDGGFNDVAANSYYAKAVAWAKTNQITGGIGSGLFGAYDSCTRAEIVTFLYRNDLAK